ncbi:MAG: hypothetical protein AAF566_06490, partial [Pseudomonadota bacterium]
TVKGLMDAAVAKGPEPRPNNDPGTQSLGYISLAGTKGEPSPATIYAAYDADFTRGAPGEARRDYSKGLYRLSEDTLSLGSPSYTVWQYYILKGGDRLVNLNNAFVPFNDETDAAIEDNDRVVWRLVSVLKNSEEADLQASRRYLS